MKAESFVPPEEIHGNPVEWVFPLDPPRFPTGYPGSGPLEKTRAFLISVSDKDTEDERFWVTCFGVTGRLMAGDMYYTLRSAKSFPRQEFAIGEDGWTRRASTQ